MKLVDVFSPNHLELFRILGERLQPRSTGSKLKILQKGFWTRRLAQNKLVASSSELVSMVPRSCLLMAFLVGSRLNTKILLRKLLMRLVREMPFLVPIL
jgi:hypothetical protein